MASQSKGMEVNCESCEKSFVKSTILRHISKSPSCKSFYGQRFIEMKKEKRRKEVFKCKNKNTEAYEKQLKRRRELYAKNTDLKQKNQEIYQRNKEKIKEENEKMRKKVLAAVAKDNAKKISN